MAGVRSLNNRLVVEKYEPEDKTAGGIYVPELAQSEVMDGIVRSVWEPTEKDKMEKNFPQVEEGAHILFHPHAGTRFVLEGREYHSIREEEILGVVE